MAKVFRVTPKRIKKSNGLVLTLDLRSSIKLNKFYYGRDIFIVLN